MIRLVVADMDGTTLRPDLTISPRTIQAIKALQDKGIRFTFATGRPDQLMKEYVDLIDLSEPIISSNGSVIGNPFQAERVHEEGLSQQVLTASLTYLEQHNITYMIYTKSGILCRENDRSRFFEARNKTLPPQQRSLFIYSDHPSSLLHDQVVNKILIIEDDPKTYDIIYNYVEAIPNTAVIQSQHRFIDINPAGVNKGKALKKLAEYYNIGLDEVVAFGDHHNDLAMIQAAGIGVAMANAVDDVLAVADDVTRSNTEDGVADWIEKHLL